MSNFGITLKRLRKAKGLNQEELAQILGCQKTTISNYETGYSSPTSATLQEIAIFFDVSISTLLGETSMLREPGSKTTEKIPVYATIPATGLLSATSVMGIDLPQTFLGEGEFFGFLIAGDRMDKNGLREGSIAITRKQDFFDDGDIVLVSVSGQPAMLTRIYRNGHSLILTPESSNSVYHPILVDTTKETSTIFGKIVKSIQSIL